MEKMQKMTWGEAIERMIVGTGQRVSLLMTLWYLYWLNLPNFLIGVGCLCFFYTYKNWGWLKK